MIKKRLNGFIIAVCLALFSVLLIALGLHDETGDDNMMQLCLSNCDGQPSSLNIWPGAVSTKIAYFLQTKIGYFAWWYVIQVVLIFVCLFIIIDWFLKSFKTNKVLKYVIPIVFTVVLFFQTIYNFNFTKTSIVLFGTGLLLLYESKKILPIVLFSLGSIFRFDSFYIALGYCFGLIFAIFFLAKKEDILDNKQQFLKKAICVIIPILVSVLFNVTCNYIYSQDSGWIKAKEYNKQASNVADYELVDYEDNLSLYQKNEISENDRSFLAGRLAGSDSEHITKEKLSGIYNTFSKRNAKLDYPHVIKRSIISIIKTFAMNPVGILSVLAFLLILIFAKTKQKIYAFLLGLGSLFYIVLFEVLGRAPMRVLFSVAFMLLCSLLPMLKDIDFSEIRIKRKGFISPIITGFLVLTLIATPVLCRVNTELQNVKEFKYINENQDKFFAYYGIDEGFSIDNLLLINDYYNTKNTFRLSLFSLTPHEKEKLESYGIKNIYKDAINSDTVRFICSKKSIEIIKTYINEHYNTESKYEFCEKIDEFNVYKIIV